MRLATWENDMPPGEVIRLLEQLALDPSSHFAAATSGWSAPWPREALILADLFDAFAHVNSKGTPAPYVRPWAASDTTRTGRTNLSPDEARRILDAHGPQKPEGTS